MYHQYMNAAKQSLGIMDSDELKDLLNDDEKLEQKVNDSVSILEREKESMITSNRNIAEQSLEKEPEIIELRGRVNDLAEKGKTLCSTVQEKLTEIKSKSGDLSSDTALALLQTAGAESEEESDQIVKQFMDNEIAVDAFLEQFMASRKTMHLRKIKAEKMTEVMRSPNLRGGPCYPPASTGFYNSPYPMGNIGMPMPNYRHF